MPTATYEQLLSETAPQAIDTEKQYQTAGSVLGDLIGKGRSRTRGETKLMRLLAVLVADYDRRHALPPEGSVPAERLQFLMDHSEKTLADLLPVFGQRSHVNEALNGKRPISLEQARRLGKVFSVEPGLFV
jgi:HTH-type transcriptional regulator/antitoxin HigA